MTDLQLHKDHRRFRLNKSVTSRRSLQWAIITLLQLTLYFFIFTNIFTLIALTVCGTMTAIYLVLSIHFDIKKRKTLKQINQHITILK